QRASKSAADAAIELVETAPGVGGLERLDQDAEVHQLVPQVRASVAVALPGAPRSAAERDRSTESQSRGGQGAPPADVLALALPAADHQAAALATPQRQIRVEGALLEALGSGEIQRHAGLLLV